MADDYKVLVTGVMTVGIAVTAYWLYQAPLQSARPLPPEQSDLPSFVVTARLWEDPIEAAEAHAKAEVHDRSAHQVDEAWKEAAAAKHVSALLVMTDGTRYPEGHEFRLNTRYALVSALGVACYVPKGDLHYFQWPRERSSSRASTAAPERPIKGTSDRHGKVTAAAGTEERMKDGQERVNVPYEWYEKRTECHQRPGPDGVVVLWINNEAVSRRPLQRLSALVRTLCDAVDSGKDCPRVAFKIIGPPDSDTFGRMLDEAVGLAPRKETLSWPGSGPIELFSPWVTAADVLKLEKAAELGRVSMASTPLPPGRVVSSAFERASIDIRYEITQDGVLFLELANELARRRIDPAQDPIAIVGEWDSSYARALSKEFSAAACAWGFLNQKRPSPLPLRLPLLDPLKAPVKDEPCIQEVARRLEGRQEVGPLEALTEALSIDPVMTNIRRYSYLRGLDGLVVQKAGGDLKKGAEKKPDGTGKAKGASVSADDLERPEGESQFDYLRRLAARIKRDEEQDAKAPRERIKAIAVLGTDIYDRLLILQALRKEFPGVLFFATDLDARFFQAGQYEWTRNVVVASAFGLELEKGLQKDIPPFRSSYQTSAFFAALQSLKRVEKRTDSCPDRDCSDRYVLPSSNKAYRSSVTPRLFEIGRRGPVDISVSPGGASDVHPPIPSKTPEIGWIGPVFGFGPWYFGFTRAVIAVAVVALIFLLFTIPASLTFVKRHPVLMIRLCALALAVWLLEPRLVRNNQEPFSLLDGVSTWPAIGLRGLALLLAWYFLVESRKAIQDNNRDLPLRFRWLLPVPAMMDASRSFTDTMLWLSENPRGRPKATHWDEVQKIWAAYQAAGNWSHRRGRIGVMIVVYVLFIILVVTLFFGDFVPWVPCRGAVNCTAEFIVLMAAGWLLLILNLFVFDATRLCKAFVGRLIDVPSERNRKVSAETYRELIQLIADRTKTVGPLVYYPFIVLSLMIVSRTRYFDNWDFPPALIVIWLINAALVFWSAYTLKRAADAARGRAITNLKALLEPQTGSTDQIRTIMEEIKGTREGSFDHILQQPAVSASLLAALAALQYYFTT